MTKLRADSSWPFRGVSRATAATVLAVLVLGVLFADSLAPFYAQGPRPGAPEADFRRALDREVPFILGRYGVPGVAIGVMLHGDPGPTYAYGLANVEHHRPMTTQTVFRVASLSKSVSAWGILTLVDDGKIDLDQPAERYLDQWPLPPSAYPSNAVTVRQLLTHTSGLNAGEDEFMPPSEPLPSPLALLAKEGPGLPGAAGPARLIAPAGASFLYSVPGYTFVQLLIERLSGETFAAYMRDQVLHPLGMTSSSYDWDKALGARLATPYLQDGRPGDIVMAQDAAADSLLSTVGDMVNFLAAPIPGQKLPVGAGVISKEMAGQLFLRPKGDSIPRMDLLGPDASCLGCFIEHSEGGPVYVTNEGNDQGWRAQIHTVPATGDGIVVLANSDRAPPAIAQIDSMWANWRGLPAPQMTRTLRAVGFSASMVVALTAGVAMWAGAGCVAEVQAKRRKFLSLRPASLLQSLAEWLVGGSIVYLWVLLRDVFELVPHFALIARLAVTGLVAAVLARTLFPLAPDAQALPPHP